MSGKGIGVKMRVFIACIANFKTGGVEVLHQLAEQLMRRNIDTYLLYFDKEFSMNNPVPPAYQKYGAKVVDEYLDAEDSVFVVPESMLSVRNWCVKGKIVVWWLSIDNAWQVDYKGFAKENIFHFVQSYYAKKYLQEKFRIESHYLSDYISSSITQYADKNRGNPKRGNICFYNPQKGYERVLELIARTEERFLWVPLEGMEPEQMAQCLCTGKVYIDLGNHPGKDRIPREAAYCGCCVITNRKGSAEYAEDVPIPEEYKIADEENYEAIINQIEYLMKHYDTVKEKYYPYIEKIKREKEVFGKEVDEALYILQKAIPQKEEKEKDTDTIVKYLQMMNRQLDNVKGVNQRMEEYIKAGCYKKGIHYLLEEDIAYRELTREIWELMRYLGE